MLDVAPRTAIILGSGLGPVVDTLKTLACIAFQDVPGFAAPTVQGHAGRLLAVEWGGVPVLAFRGRMHYYEGHDWDRCVGTVKLANRLGVTTMLLTNAAGGLHPNLNPGDLMILCNHVVLLHSKAWRDLANETPRVNPYSPQLVKVLQEVNPSLISGVYAGLTGPTYETPAEIRALAAMGADAVGMSTVQEALSAAALGMSVAAVSCITNKAAGLGAGTLHHGEVQEVASRGDVVERMNGLVTAFLQRTATP